jgi:REP element-mobilizing transposase RayT
MASLKSSPSFKPFDPDAEVRKFRNHLPHWRQAGVTYFVTTRLADSVPQGTLRQWREERDLWLRLHDCADAADIERLPDRTRREYHARFTAKFHEFLDAGTGACWLRRPEAAAIVASALRRFDGARYALGDFVVMPNHLHALVTPSPDDDLSDILHSWKRFSAREINKLAGREGTFWQAESFNHIVRSEAQLDRFRRYIAENPAKARLRKGEYLLWQAAT